MCYMYVYTHVCLTSEVRNTSEIRQITPKYYVTKSTYSALYPCIEHIIMCIEYAGPRILAYFAPVMFVSCMHTCMHVCVVCMCVCRWGSRGLRMNVHLKSKSQMVQDMNKYRGATSWDGHQRWRRTPLRMVFQICATNIDRMFTFFQHEKRHWAIRMFLQRNFYNKQRLTKAEAYRLGGHADLWLLIVLFPWCDCISTKRSKICKKNFVGRWKGAFEARCYSQHLRLYAWIEIAAPCLLVG